MPTRPAFTVTKAPQDIVAALSLNTQVLTSHYKMQNIGTVPMFCSQRSTAPADLQTLIADKGHILAPAGIRASPASAESSTTFDASQGLLFVWTLGGVSELVVSDAVWQSG